MAYSIEEKAKAVELYVKYGCSVADTIRELGYPSRQALRNWYGDYLKDGEIRGRKVRASKFSDEQKMSAVEHYLEHGRNLTRTMRAMGYPASRGTLATWVDEIAPGERRRGTVCNVYNMSREGKAEAVIALETRTVPAAAVADAIGVTRAVLYSWRNELLDKGVLSAVPSNKTTADASALEDRVAALEKQVRELELRKAILEGTIELLGKDPGADPNRLTNREKAMLVMSLRPAWKLRELLAALSMPKSSYDYQVGAMGRTDKYADVREAVEASFAASREAYGRRRIHDDLAASGVVVSEKVISAIMKDAGLVARGRKRHCGYSSYKGEVSKHPGNKVNRDFTAALPNFLWLTDVTQFHIPAGKVYLSPIIDCFDGMAVSWTISTSPNAEMANSMLRNAISTLGKGERPLIHSDCGCHYRWPEWISICEGAGLTRSMSKKGCSPDNSACEGFFGRLKNEMFYERDWRGVTIEEFAAALDRYIHWYNEVRIKRSLGGMSPLDYRRSLGLAA